LGQQAIVSLDAYPRQKVKAVVDHISYESKLVNNVTMYEVDILPEEVPGIFRSGMTANVSIVEDSRQDVLRLPVEAIRREDRKTFVMVEEGGFNGRQRLEVQTGLEGEEYIEITGGVDEGEAVIVERTQFDLPKGRSGSNPFMPSRRRQP
jgi:macrolide-specific efflux system membrane fusion protein